MILTTSNRVVFHKDDIAFVLQASERLSATVYVQEEVVEMIILLHQVAVAVDREAIADSNLDIKRPLDKAREKGYL